MAQTPANRAGGSEVLLNPGSDLIYFSAGKRGEGAAGGGCVAADGADALDRARRAAARGASLEHLRP